MTKCLEGDNSSSGFGSLWQTLPNLQALWAHYTEAKERPQSVYMASPIKFRFEKLSTYFVHLIVCPDISFYAVATLLHPRLRLNWFQTQWKNYPQLYQKARKSLKNVFKEYLSISAEVGDSQDLQLLPLSRQKLPNSTSTSDLYKRTIAVDLHLLTNTKNKRQRQVGQLEEYFEALVTDLTTGSEGELQLLKNPWDWWLQSGRHQYPILFKIATDYLTIPCTSCNCERAFSTAGRTITCDCNSLSGSTIEALQLQKNWLGRGVVKSSLTEFQKHIETVDRKLQASGMDSPISASFSPSTN
jgi:hypothetical protein